ncbi:MAG: hypothetical protein AB7R89_09570 [Dehalococcoidia bacterium]
MNESTVANPNPFTRLARSLPAGFGAIAALVARAAGAALAIAVAVEQSYDGTRIFAATIAALVLISCLPFPSRLRGRTPWLGAALVFFGGALLAHFPAGMLMVFCGALAAIGTAIDEQQRGHWSHVLTFFAGFALTIAIAVATILSIEG